MEKMEKVEYNMLTGAPINVVNSLERSLSIFMLRYKSVKVGITGREPQLRFNEHKKDGWERMVVKYETTSQSFANQLEDFFITYRPKLTNKWIGTSNLSEDGKNYLYFLLKGKR